MKWSEAKLEKYLNQKKVSHKKFKSEITLYENLSKLYRLIIK